MTEKNSNVNEMLLNRAKAETANEVYCNDCIEDVVFLMKDKEHAFSVGLSTIMECLEAAILHGDLPKLPQSWCFSVRDAYGASFEEEAYYDDHIPKEGWK